MTKTAKSYAEVSHLVPSKKRGESSGTDKSHTQQSIDSSLARATKYSRDSPHHKDITRSIAYHIGKDGVPLSTVERPGFVRMIQKLNPRYDLPSRKHFSKQAIPTLYCEIRDVVISDLKDICEYALTTDLWTSCATEPYLTVTLHYINSDWELKSVCLQTVSLLKDHTGQNIADCLIEVLANWNLNLRNLVAATTDSGSNVVAAFAILEGMRISCFGHNLDLGVKKALSDARIQRALARCKSIVSVFNRSWKKSRDLKEKQELLELPIHKLKKDVSTRWGSTFEMISRFIEQQQAVCAVLAEDRKYWSNMPTDDELSVLENVKDVLENVFYLTDALAGEKEVTASSLCCILTHLRSKLSVKETDGRVAVIMKNAMLDDLNQRYCSPQVLKLIEFASFLDPRFKTQYLENKEEILSLVKEECLTVVQSQEESPPLEAPRVETPADTSLPRPICKKKGLSAILQHIEEENSLSTENASTPQDKVENEIASYLEYPKMSSATNPLDWWKSEQRQFPISSG